MTSDDIKIFLPIVLSALSTATGGVAWFIRYLLKQNETKDTQVLKSLEVQQQSTTNGTLAIQQAAQNSVEVRAVLEEQTAAIKAQTVVLQEVGRTLDQILAQLNARPVSRSRRP